MSEREKLRELSAADVVKADNRTGSAHMTDREAWGILMAAELNAILLEAALGAQTEGDGGTMTTAPLTLESIIAQMEPRHHDVGIKCPRCQLESYAARDRQPSGTKEAI